VSSEPDIQHAYARGPEDMTEPARCAYEVNGTPQCGQFEDGELHQPGHVLYHTYVAPAPDDEMTPGPSVERDANSPHVWRVNGNGYYIPTEVEAAIRAPLDEIIEHAWRARDNWQRMYNEEFNARAAVTAERDRLLKVAYEDARTLHYVTHIGKNGFEDFNDCDKPKCVNARAALAAPATEEVQAVDRRRGA
jgi:hypothetical protein